MAPIPVTRLAAWRKVEMVMRQLVRGDVVIVYDEGTGTANIVPKEDVKLISQEED
jgi:uncharacterized protein YheU (UPF0270 family)